jgi:hypothetical protein
LQSRHEILNPLIGQPWVWQSRNCWDFACHVERELFGRELPRVAVPADQTKRWVLEAIERTEAFTTNDVAALEFWKAVEDIHGRMNAARAEFSIADPVMLGSPKKNFAVPAQGSMQPRSRRKRVPDSRTRATSLSLGSMSPALVVGG